MSSAIPPSPEEKRRQLAGLARRLAGYSTAAGVTLALGPPASAGVVRTVLSPAQTYANPSTFNLDVDNNMVEDFGFALFTGFSTAIRLVRLNHPTNAFIAASSGGYNVAVALNVSQTVSAGKTFNTGYVAVTTLATGNLYGQFHGQGRKFVGLRFDRAGATHYGFAEIEVPLASGQFTIYQYAYESVAGQSIQTSNIPAGPIPEPGSLLLLATGAADLLAYRRRLKGDEDGETA